MHARTVSILFEPHNLDELVSLYENAIVPTARELKGFKGATLLIDVQRRRGMSITLWETESDMLAGEASGYYQAQVAKIAPLLNGHPVESHYSIAFQTEPLFNQT